MYQNSNGKSSGSGESSQGIANSLFFGRNEVEIVRHAVGLGKPVEMPKKSQRQQAKESQLVAWYKWEFLRRNVEYRKDYKEFIREFGGWFEKHGYWYDQTIEHWSPKSFRFFEAVIAPRARIICEKWEIREPYSPEWAFTKFGGYAYKPRYEVYLPTDCNKESAGALWAFSHLSFEKYGTNLPESESVLIPEPTPDYYFSLRFDLRLSLSSQLRVAKDLITSRKEKYRQAHPQPTRTPPAVRRRLDRYDVYLKVWDLRASNEKFEAIGALVFPGEPRGAQHAVDSFKRAQELINGGYKELR